MRILDGKVKRHKWPCKIRERGQHISAKVVRNHWIEKNRFIWSQIATPNGVITIGLQANVEIVRCPGVVYAAVVRLFVRLSVTYR